MRQSSSLLFMVRPKDFRSNEETSDDNVFQDKGSGATVAEQALNEFDRFVHLLEDKGIKVYVGHISDDLDTPDALYPNNWLSFHENGLVALYPMKAENRRLERREYLIEELVNHCGLHMEEIVDFTEFESHESYLEGTGSMVLDRSSQVVYAGISERTDEQAVRIFCDEMGYSGVLFETSVEGKPVYHTNVVLSIASQFAILCEESIPDLQDRKIVIESLLEAEKEVIRIDIDQMKHFAANGLEVYNEDGKKYFIMSQSAANSLNEEQKSSISKYAEILSIPLDTIERFGGGSARCMLCEVFLPKI
ncbi:MAG: hypothetical protein RL226_2309 [Bacteroidota bacterium]